MSAGKRSCPDLCVICCSQCQSVFGRGATSVPLPWALLSSAFQFARVIGKACSRGRRAHSGALALLRISACEACYRRWPPLQTASLLKRPLHDARQSVAQSRDAMLVLLRHWRKKRRVTTRRRRSWRRRMRECWPRDRLSTPPLSGPRRVRRRRISCRHGLGGQPRWRPRRRPTERNLSTSGQMSNGTPPARASAEP